MSAAETAARAYVAMWMEPDREVRARLLEESFAVDGRIVARGSTLRGRAEVWKSLEEFFGHPLGLRARLTSAIDAGATTFRFRSVVERGDGTPFLEFLDTGEIDDRGRISTIYTFIGPLADG